MSFRVVDPPQVPAGMKRPNRLRLMMMVAAAALGSGLGLAFLLGQMRPTFNDERTLREVTGFRVLGTVAMTWSAKQKTRRRLGLFAFVLSNLGLLAAFAAVMLLALTAARA
jgi:hypothetical protein